MPEQVKLEDAGARLGPLQRDVLSYVWEHAGCTVRDCRDQLEAGGRSYAYTTIQTVFDALHRKRMVSRRRTKTAYRYTAVSSRASLFADGLRELVSRLKLAPEPVASCLVEALEEGEGERLRALISELRSRGHLPD